MSDDCSLVSESLASESLATSEEVENAKSVAGAGVKRDPAAGHSTRTVGPGGMKTLATGYSPTHSVPLIPPTEQGQSTTVIKGVKTFSAEVKHASVTTLQLQQPSSKVTSDPQSPSRPLFHPPSLVTQQVGSTSASSSSESTDSTHSTDILPRPPNNTPSNQSQHGPLNWLSQSHPNIHGLAHAVPRPPSPASLGAKLRSSTSVPIPPNLKLFHSRKSSGCSSSTNDTNTPKTETKKSVSACLSPKTERKPARMHTTRKSLSQPVIVLPSEHSGKVRKKKHKFISPSLTVVNYSSTDSLPSLRFSVVKSSNKEPHKSKLRPKNIRPKNRQQVHPLDEATHVLRPPEEPVIQSPSSTSGSSVTSGNPSMTLSTRSSVSLSLGPLLTTSLRIRRTKSAMDNQLGGIGVAQLESCFPDRHIRLCVVTWNMQERKVGVVRIQ